LLRLLAAALSALINARIYRRRRSFGSFKVQVYDGLTLQQREFEGKTTLSQFHTHSSITRHLASAIDDGLVRRQVLPTGRGGDEVKALVSQEAGAHLVDLGTRAGRRVDEVQHGGQHLGDAEHYRP